MLIGLDIDKCCCDLSNEQEKEVVNSINEAKKIYQKVFLKEKRVQSGRYINIYVYDKRVYRTVLYKSIQVG